ncbi:MAG TPA: hypothetical protein DCO77_04335 [Nitrospiraceae bacterium]|nr:hypothetical protein [Nitrospiraceae bacterium]
MSRRPPLSQDDLDQMPEDELIKISNHILPGRSAADVMNCNDLSRHPFVIGAKNILLTREMKRKKRSFHIALWTLIFTAIIFVLTSLLVYDTFFNLK